LTEEAEVVICYSTNCHDAIEDEREPPMKAAVHEYLAALEAGDVAKVLSLFSADG
jgi:hypothetical protein